MRLIKIRANRLYTQHCRSFLSFPVVAWELLVSSFLMKRNGYYELRGRPSSLRQYESSHFESSVMAFLLLFSRYWMPGVSSSSTSPTCWWRTSAATSPAWCSTRARPWPRSCGRWPARRDISVRVEMWRLTAQARRLRFGCARTKFILCIVLSWTEGKATR